MSRDSIARRLRREYGHYQKRYDEASGEDKEFFDTVRYTMQGWAEAMESDDPITSHQIESLQRRADNNMAPLGASKSEQIGIRADAFACQKICRVIREEGLWGSERRENA